MDKKDFRTALLGKSEADKNVDNGRSITLTIDSGLPMVNVDDVLMDNFTINSVTHSPSLTGGDDVLNTLVDKEDPNRYVYICTTLSAVTKAVVRLYYDAMFKDIIVVPNTETLGTDSATDMNRNQNYDLRGYVISGGDDIKHGNFSGTIKKDFQFDLPVPNSDISATHNAVILNGIAPTMGGRLMAYDIDDQGKYSLRDNRRLPVGLLDLGTVNDIFGTAVSLPIYNVFQGTTDMYKMKYLGIQNVDKVYFLLDF